MLCKSKDGDPPQQLGSRDHPLGRRERGGMISYSLD